MQVSARQLFERARRGQTASLFLRNSRSGGLRRWMWRGRRLRHSILRTNRLTGNESVNFAIWETGHIAFSVGKAERIGVTDGKPEFVACDGTNRGCI